MSGPVFRYQICRRGGYIARTIRCWMMEQHGLHLKRQGAGRGECGLPLERCAEEAHH
jgi:hypothetical protein